MSNLLANITIGTTPPINPSANALWISTAKKDLRIAHSPNEHRVALAAGVGQGTQFGTTYTWEGTAIEEPDCFYNSTLSRYELYYATSGGGIGHAYSASIEGPWARTSSTGAPNLSGAYHFSTYIEGSTIYMFYVDSATNLNFKVATASLSTPQTLSGSTTVFTTTLSGGTLMGNQCVIKLADGTYRMFFEHSYNSQSWQSGIAECATVNGTYTLKTPTLSTLQPTWFNGVSNAGVGGMKVFLENGEYVAFYHGIDRRTGGASQPASDGFVATSTDTINWTVQNEGNPIIRKCHPYEVEQVADLCPVDLIGGGTHCFWDAWDNIRGKAYIMHAQMSPAIMQWSGYEWQPVLRPFDPLNQAQLRRTPLKTAIYTAVNLDDVIVDPSTTANLAITLPRAAINARCRVSHVGPVGSTGTVLIGANASDYLGSAATLARGQSASYECFTELVWTRVA